MIATIETEPLDPNLLNEQIDNDIEHIEADELENIALDRSNGRRLTKKAKDTQRRILECALELFRERGFDKTSMRDIADAAKVAVGASYYYFKTKEELVLAYYEDACSKDTEFVIDLVKRVKSFKERYATFLRYKVNQLSANRGFMNVLARSAANPDDPLSPFGEQTKAIREDAMDLMRMMVEGSDIKISEKLKPYLTGILWLQMMGTIFLWIHDRTANQNVTERVIEFGVGLTSQLFWLSSLPLTGPINDLAVHLFDLILESQGILKSEETSKREVG